jgi:hypothetical protein
VRIDGLLRNFAAYDEVIQRKRLISGVVQSAWRAPTSLCVHGRSRMRSVRIALSGMGSFSPNLFQRPR